MVGESVEEFLKEVDETEELGKLMKIEEKKARDLMLVAVAVFLLTVFAVVAALPMILESVI